MFQTIGFPPGYKTNGARYGSNNLQNRKSSQSMQQNCLAQQMQITYPTTSQQANSIENVHSDVGSSPFAYVNPGAPRVTSGGVRTTLQEFTPQHIQHLICQFNSQVRLQEPHVPSSRATIAEHGAMATTSSSGSIPFPSTTLKYEHTIITFQDHCISTIHSFLPRDAWIIDSGAFSHVCSYISMFTELTPVHIVMVTLPNGTRVPIMHIGIIRLSDSLILYNVLHVPDFHFNLISVSNLLKTLFCAAHFFSNVCLLQELTQGLMIGRGNIFHNLYILEKPSLSPSSSPAVLCGFVLSDDHLWHLCLGHPSPAVLQRILPSLKSSSSSLESRYVLQLKKKLAFISHNNLSPKPFDVWGPFSTNSVEGFRYFFTLVDYCTRMTWVYMLRNKSDVSVSFPAFLKHANTQYNAKVKAIRSDNAPELAFTDIIKENGMIHYFSCAYTPQQNSEVERKHKHLLNVARALLFQSNVPLKY